MSVVASGLISESIELLQTLIRINTSNPGHPEQPAAAFVTSFLAAGNVKARILANESGRASVVAKIDGTDAANYPSLLLLSHLDTVPVTHADLWSHGPFSGDIADGFVWGRGALDDKGRTAINAATIAALAVHPPPEDVLFAALADEEEGGTLGAAWLRNDHPE
ncbi:MAG: M20/M25/M40 family metallo-hydrolase, partial [Chloroflexi bacterium]|nr:M20/M25/M40 family metallo-hydrolase [Chloroflexota bacterium]